MAIDLIDAITSTRVMNILDISSIFIIVICGAIGYKRGLILSIFNALSWILSLIISSIMYPQIGKLIRENTSFYDNIKNSIINNIDISGVISEIGIDATKTLQSKQIESMNLPQGLINSFLENNNPEAYIALGAEGFEDYISGFIANGLINIFSIVIIFIITMSAIRGLAITLDFISKLPVINTFNKIGGLVAGLIPAIMIIWIMITILSMVFVTNDEHMFFDMLETSKIVTIFGESNPIMEMITTIFP